MDPRYEDDIDTIVSNMEGEFTAKDVVGTLERMHPTPPSTRPLPDARKMSEYLRTSQGVEKMGRGRVNSYRYDKDWEKGDPEEEAPSPSSVEEDTDAVPGPPPGTVPLEAVQAAMEAIEECEHPEGFAFQDAVEFCPICTANRPFVDPYVDVIAELTRHLSPGAIMKMPNTELFNMYRAFMRWSELIDKSASGGKARAEEYAAWAEACAMKLTINARNQRKNIRRA